jgi:hypothetical protein
MKTNYSDVVCLNVQPDHVYTNGTLVAAGPITKQPATSAFRVVIVARPLNDGTEFVVWYECWNETPIGEFGRLIFDPDKSNFNEGFYTTDIIRAVEEFCKRINKPDQLRSIERS